MSVDETLRKLEKCIKDAESAGTIYTEVCSDVLKDAFSSIRRLQQIVDRESLPTYRASDVTAEEKFIEILESKKDKLIEAALKSLEPFEMRDVVAQQKETIDRQNEEIKALISGQITLQNHLASVIRKETLEEFSMVLLKIIKEHHYLLMDVNNTTDKGMFTIGIEQAVAETIKELERKN